MLTGWIDQEINRASIMLGELENCQHVFEARKIYHNIIEHSLKLVQTGVWEMGARLNEARMHALKHPSARPSIREQPAADSLAGWRVLLADDERALLDLISRKLGGLGCQVTAAEDGYQAWSFFKRSPQCFDLVLTDYDMPEMTGAELASRIRELRPKLPIVLLSGSPNLADLDPSLRETFSLMLSKPVSLSNLQDSIQELVLPAVIDV